ncbi:MAG TPA: hypothetical protein PLU35_00545 [Phycisphaerales bacterium]|nr:hypothetical protein [Phycisphaerales bacterium]
MPRTRSMNVWLAFSGLFAAAPAVAQAVHSTSLGDLHAEALVRIDPTVGDVGPLGVSMRLMPIDLLRPASFEEVYQVPNRPNLFMRVHGGVAAVFPRSVYTTTPWGMRAEVPPGTIFHIGSIAPENLIGLTPPTFTTRPQLDLSLDRRFDTRAAPQGVDPALSQVARFDASIWTNDAYRQHRLDVLAGRARRTVDSGQLTVDK